MLKYLHLYTLCLNSKAIWTRQFSFVYRYASRPQILLFSVKKKNMYCFLTLALNNKNMYGRWSRSCGWNAILRLDCCQMQCSKRGHKHLIATQWKAYAIFILSSICYCNRANVFAPSKIRQISSFSILNSEPVVKVWLLKHNLFVAL